MKTLLDKHIESIRAREELADLKQTISVSLFEKPNRNQESPVFWHVAIRERNLGAVNC